MHSKIVCLSACLSVRSRNSKTTWPNFTNFFLHIACGRGLVLFWHRCDALCTSSFAGDVMYSHNGSLVHHVYYS